MCGVHVAGDGTQQDCDVCGAGEYEHSACSTTTNTDCRTCDVCVAGEYEHAACTATTNADCRTCTVCLPSFNQTRECANGLNAVCDVCPDGFYCPGGSTPAQACSACGYGQFTDTPCTAVADATCGQYTSEVTDCSSVQEAVTGGWEIKSVAGGDKHHCALLDNNMVKCWGVNANGVLGQGWSDTAAVVGDVTGALGDSLPFVQLGSQETAREICSGFGHVCALLYSKRIKCWGLNDKGQLGILSTVSHRGTLPAHMGDGLKAVDLGSLTYPVSLACGWKHTCAVMEDGTARCWGDNTYGQLGIASAQGAYGLTGADVFGDAMPAVNTGGGITQITAGHTYTCVLMASSGTVRCFGIDGGYDDLAVRNGATAPTDIDLGTGVGLVTQVMGVGIRTICALFLSGFAKCWGYDTDGAVGNGVAKTDIVGDGRDASYNPLTEMGDALPYLHPAGNLFVERFIANAVDDTACAVMQLTHVIVCWGQGYMSDANAAVVVPGFAGVPAAWAAKSASNSALCVLLLSAAPREVRCTGSGFFGDQDHATPGVPVAHASPTPALDFGAGVEVGGVCVACPEGLFESVAPSAIVGGGGCYCVLFDNGSVKCWGANNYGQLGVGLGTSDKIGEDVGTMGDAWPFVNLGASEVATQMCGGGAHVCVLLFSRQVLCWGNNDSGQLGTTGANRNTPGATVNLGSSPYPVHIACGSSHTCAVMSDGTATCWGNNQYGQLGRSSATNPMTASASAAINLGSGVLAAQIAASTQSTCVLTTTAEVKCFGLAAGYGDWIFRGQTSASMGDNLPTVDLGTTGVGTVVSLASVAREVYCALFDDARVKCWGSDTYGSLGNGPDLTARMGDNAGEMGDTLAFLSTPGGAGVARLVPSAIRYSACLVLLTDELACWGEFWDTSPTNANTIAGADASVLMGATSQSTALGQNACVFLRDRTVQCWGTFWFGTGDGTNQPLVTIDVGSVSKVGLTECEACDTCAADAYEATVCGGATNTACETCSTECEFANLQTQTDACTLQSDIVCEYTCTESVTYVAPRRQRLVASGLYHTCAAFADGRMKCWGRNEHGQLGVDVNSGQTIVGDAPEELGDAIPFVNFGAGRTVVSMACGATHTCALLDNGVLKCWGRNDQGQLGLGDKVDRGIGTDLSSTAVDVTFANGEVPTAVFAGFASTCATYASGACACWGDNRFQQTGTVDMFSEPPDVFFDALSTPLGTVPLGLHETAIEMAVNWKSACVLVLGGRVRCWGQYTPYGRTTAVAFSDLDPAHGGSIGWVDFGTRLPVDAIRAVGENMMCAIFRDGNAKCWGEARNYLLRTATSSDILGDDANEVGEGLPWLDLGPSLAGAIADLGGVQWSACAQTTIPGSATTGTQQQVICWGDNADKQLGIGETTTDVGATAPTDAVQGLPAGGALAQVAVGASHACAVLHFRSSSSTSDAQVWCWGKDVSRAVGQGGSASSGTAQQAQVQGTSAAAPDAARFECATCTACPPRYVQNTSCSLTEDTRCVACAEGEFATSDHTACFACAAGNDCRSGSQQACTGGTFSEAGWGQCFPCRTSCEQIDEELIVGSCTTFSDTVCVACARGFWCASYVATPCDDAHYCPGDAEKYPCTPCASDEILTRPCNTTHDAVCEACSGGEYVEYAWTETLAAGDRFACVIVDNGRVKCWGTGAMNGYVEAEYNVPYTGHFYTSVAQGGVVGTANARGQLDDFGWVPSSDSAAIIGVEYMQLDLAQVAVVLGVVTQGRFLSHHVTSFKVTTSTDGVVYNDVDGGAIFPGNSDGDTRVVTRFASGSLGARFVRIYPWSWGGYPAMRAGVLLGVADALGDEASETGANLAYVDLHAAPATAQVGQIACGFSHACALFVGGNVKCFGSNAFGEAGQGHIAPLPTPLSTMDFVDLAQLALQVATGTMFSCAVLNDHTVKCWGENSEGQLGLGSAVAFVASPSLAVNLGARARVRKLAIAGRSVCALLLSGAIKCWGQAAAGSAKIGLSATDMGDNLTPQTLATPTTGGGGTVLDIGTQGGRVFCATFAAPTRPECWGTPANGHAVTPTVGFDTGVVRMQGASEHACALTADGLFRCWGVNTYGRLGDGTVTVRPGPDNAIEPAGLARWSVVAFATGTRFTCVLMRGGGDSAIHCVGSNAAGELAQESVTVPEAHTFGVAPVLHPTTSPLQSAALGCAACHGCPSTHKIGGVCSGAADTQCDACPAGQFATANNSACFGCAAGFDCQGGSAVPCSAGLYSTDGVCSEPCAAGFFCAGDGSQQACTVCGPGSLVTSACSASTDTTCIACPANAYCDTPNLLVAPPCPVHSTSPTGSSDLRNCTCEGGYVQLNSTHHRCVPCEASTYCFGEQQYECPRPNQTSLPMSDSYDDCYCVAGTYAHDNQHDCRVCPYDFYCPFNSTAPTQCPSNSSTHSVAVGNTRELDCQCDRGHYSGSGGSGADAGCALCPVDFWCPGHNVTVACSNLTATHGREGGDVELDCTPIAGYYRDVATNLEHACPKGYVCAGDLTPPQACPANSSTPALGAAHVSECECNAQFVGACSDNYCEAGFCDACPVDTYCPGGAVSYACPALTVAAVGAATAASDCVCQAGYNGGGGGPCSLCANNSWCPGGEVSYDCDANAFSPHGSNEVGDCACNAGYYGDAGASCNLCEVGFHCAGAPTAGTTAVRERCPDFSTTDSAGYSSITACVCNAGYFTEDGNSCLQCTAASYCQLEGRSACPANASSPPRSDEPGDCVCNAGYEGINGGECRLCGATGVQEYCPGGAGTHVACVDFSVAPLGASGPAACKCLLGYYGAQDAGACSECRAGKWCAGGAVLSVEANCPINSDSAPGSSAIEQCQCNPSYYTTAWGLDCLLCPENRFCEGGAKGNESVACPANTDAPAGSSSVVDCLCIEGFKGNSTHGCVPCAAEEICLGGGGSLRCPSNSLPLPWAQNTSGCECLAGFYGANGAFCVTCPADEYCPGGNVRVPCPGNAGTLAAGKGLPADCLCRAAYYGAAGGNCSDCEAGFWCAGNGAHVREACPANTTSAVRSSSRTNCKCVGGLVGSNPDTCAVCPANSYCRGHTDEVRCDENDHATSAAGSNDVSACACNAGYYGASGSECLACPPGAWCPGGNVNTPCTPKSASPGLSFTASNCSCNAGYFHHENTTAGTFTCDECAVDSYCFGGGAVVEPQTCPNNTDTNGATARSNVLQCRCSPQWFGPDPFSCQECQPGFTCPGGNVQTSCPLHSRSAPGAQSTADCECIAGYFGTTAAACAPAPHGTYSLGGNDLRTCPPNSNTTGSTGLRDSLVKCVCDDGFWGNEAAGQVCTSCPLELYCQDGARKTCEDNRRTRSPQSASELACVANEGYYGPAGNGAALPCPEHSYCVGDGRLTACPNGTKTIEDRRFSIGHCLCIPGTRGTSLAGCTGCLENNFCPGGNEQRPCAGGSGASAHSDEQTDCVCNKGYYGPAGVECTACVANEWCPGGGGNERYDCAANSQSPALSWAQAQCVCRTGYYASAAPPTLACTLCAANSYCPFDTLFGQPVQNECPENAISLEGATMIGSCYCPDGFRSVAGGNGECELCPAGEICSGGNLTCPENAQSIAGASSLADCRCNTGFFSAQHGQTCSECEVNTYCPGGTTVELCPANTMSSRGAASASECYCAAGWVSASGNAPCDACAANFYCDGGDSGRAQQACNAFAISAEGASMLSECECAPEYYGSPGGSPSPCQECDEGFYCPGGSEISGCPTRTIAPEGSTDEADCRCAFGYHGPDKDSCIECGYGFFCAGGPSRVACPEHANTTTELAETNAQCICGRGFFRPGAAGSACVLCTEGYYCTGNNNNERTPCPGLKGVSVGATRIEDCKCGAGQYRPTVEGDCAPCPFGQYCPDGDAVDCPGPSATTVAGATSVDACECETEYARVPQPTATQVCRACDEGYWCDGSSTQHPCNVLLTCYPPFYRMSCSSQGDHTCALCAVPEHAAMAALKAFNNECAWRCNAGYFAAAEGATACTACATEPCTNGFTRTVCPAGATADASCVTCGNAPANAQVVSAACEFRCKRGYWDAAADSGGGAVLPHCCSDNAFLNSTTGGCECLPGWVGDGLQCLI